LLKGCLTVTNTAIPQHALIVSSPFGSSLDASRVVAAIARGLHAGGRPGADRCPLELPDARRNETSDLLDALGFDARMRSARAVIVGAWRMHERTLAGSVTFEIATRARQRGVPAYAVTGENALDAFDLRILDLQLIIEARSARALAAAGRKLAMVV
jgi:glycerate kinase